MSEWWVNLQGADFDLSQLATILNSSGFCIQRSEGGYYLTADSLNELGTAYEVWEAASTQLQFLNGLTRLMLPGSKPLSVGNIQRIEADGKTDYYLLAKSGAYALQGSVVAIPTTGGGETTQSVQQDPMPGWVSLAQGNQAVARVLAMFGKVTQPWKDLYPIYEIIEHDVGGEDAVVFKKWTSRNQIERFRRTACHPETAGDDSRHGVSAVEPPPNPMTPADAIEFIRSLVTQWLTFKQSQHRP